MTWCWISVALAAATWCCRGKRVCLVASTSIISHPLALKHHQHSPEGTIAITGTPTEGETLTADASGLSDADGLGSFSYQWQAEVEGVWTDIAEPPVTPSPPMPPRWASALRVIVSYTDGGGTNESVISAVTDPD
jgi:hypothetical protein